jgi:glutamine amidotransferase
MQILTSVGYENGIHNGLNLVEGKTISLTSDEIKGKESARIPNMGWMQVEIVDTHSPNLLFKNLGDKFDAYFAHSFEVRLENIKSMTSMSYFGERQVVASFAQDNVFGVQFHPEKSGKLGLAIIDNFLNSVYE